MNNADMPAMPHTEYDADGNMPKGLTKREQACITLCVPETGDEELDAIIRKAQRAKITTAAMQGLLAHRGDVEYAYEQISIYAGVYTDALLAELERTK